MYGDINLKNRLRNGVLPLIGNKNDKDENNSDHDHDNDSNQSQEIVKLKVDRKKYNLSLSQDDIFNPDIQLNSNF